MHGLFRVVISGLTLYGYICVVMAAIALWRVLTAELSGRAGTSPMTFRIASWLYPVLCFGMAEASWYLARLLS